jgi:hypothetical protein
VSDLKGKLFYFNNQSMHYASVLLYIKYLNVVVDECVYLYIYIITIKKDRVQGSRKDNYSITIIDAQIEGRKVNINKAICLYGYSNGLHFVYIHYSLYLPNTKIYIFTFLNVHGGYCPGGVGAGIIIFTNKGYTFTCGPYQVCFQAG